jgi:hypothetical protein
MSAAPTARIRATRATLRSTPVAQHQVKRGRGRISPIPERSAAGGQFSRRR